MGAKRIPKSSVDPLTHAAFWTMPLYVFQGLFGLDRHFVHACLTSPCFVV